MDDNNKVVAMTTSETKAVPDSDTKAKTEQAAIGQYKHVFKKPYTYEDKTYTELDFNFESLIGTDMIAIEDEMAAVGQYVLSPEISTAFLAKMAARAAKVGSDVIENTNITEFGKIKNKARNFLISTGF